MFRKRDRLIHLPVPFLKDKTAILLDVDADWLSPAFYPDYKTVVLPELVESLTPELLQYMFPGQEEVTARDMDARIRELAGLDSTPGFLYKKNGSIYFQVLPDGPDAAPARDVLAGSVCKYRSARFEKNLSYDTATPEPMEISPACIPGAPAEFTGERADAIIAAWEEIERRFGVTPADVEVLLGYRVKLSRLSITVAGDIYLTDFENKEVKMDDLTKAVYFYYLKHPEGARLKELQEHESEILGYYMGITGRDDIQGIRNSVHNLLDPYANNLNTCFSRIKRAFKNVVGERIASFYYVDGSYAEVRTVKLDRDLVLWEH